MAEQIDPIEQDERVVAESSAAEVEKSSVEMVYQKLAVVVRDHIFSPLLLLDHIASRPPGIIRPVAE